MADLSGLLAVMMEMRRLVALPDNDFAWSAWRDHQAAVADMIGPSLPSRRGRCRSSRGCLRRPGPCKKSASGVAGERSSSR